MAAERTPKIQQVMQELEARFGHPVVQQLRDYRLPVLYPTGLSALDDLLGGGFVPGAITTFEGSITCGRETLVQRVLAAQSGVKVWMDIWGTFDAESALNCGLELDRLVIVRPQDRHEAVELLGALIHLRIPLLVLDDATSSLGAELPARTLTQLAQAGSVLLALPPVRRSMNGADARLLVERGSLIRRSVLGDLSGFRSRISVIEQRGIPAGTSITMDILIGDP